MKEQYKVWIQDNVDEPYGNCYSFSVKMQEVFPELTLVRGHYYCPVWGERQHWWLTDPDGDVVDPTAAQFPSTGIGHYEPWDENQPEPTGKCPNCGGLVYDGGTCCSENCHIEYTAYCTNPF